MSGGSSSHEARGTSHIDAASISSTVAALLQQPRRGTVLATFARSAYLDVEDSIVAIVAEDLLNGPLNVVLPESSTPPFERLTVGGPVTASEETLRVDAWPSIALHRATRWDPRITPWTMTQMMNVMRHVDVLMGTTLATTSTEHLMHRRMQQALAGLRSGLRMRSPVEVQTAAGDLAGLGAGLTPSGDDVLVGALVALAALPDDHTDLREAIRSATAGRTTRISAAYLQAAAGGDASEAWQRLLAALAGDAPDDVIATGRHMLTYGETSGADMLTGFILAMANLYDLHN
ncbi:MAG TPA: DUF2877 domain-containing protein [bacterium]|nr:DUF2877 domain-containing protein [bacterium]